MPIMVMPPNRLVKCRGDGAFRRGSAALVIAMKKWCGREDSNFHGIAPTATSTLRVYQFRHDRKFLYIFAQWGIPNAGPAIKHGKEMP